MILMSDGYDQILNATIQHLEDLKGRGVRFVPVSPESLARLNQDQRRVSARIPQAPYAPAPQTVEKQLAKMTPPAPKAETAKPVTEQALSLPLPGESVAAPAIPALSAAAKAVAFAELRQRAMVCV